MNRFYKKALLFQWFQASKWAIILSIVIWMIALFSDEYNIKYIFFSSNISTLANDRLNYISFSSIIVLILITALIYFSNSGFNKKNKYFLFDSGPFKRDDIFNVNIITCLITAVIFAVLYIYLGICFYIRNSELMSYASNFVSVILLDSIKIIYISVLTYLSIALIDMFFSNLFISIISLVVLPSSIYLSLIINLSMLFDRDYISYRIMDRILEFLSYTEISNTNNYRDYEILTKDLLIDYGILSIIIIILIISIKILNKKIKIENMSNFFVFRYVKNITLIIITIALTSNSASIIVNSLSYSFKSVKLLYIITFIIVFIFLYKILNIFLSRFIK